MRKRKIFIREFKLEATRMLEEGRKPAADLARELGIRRNQLYKWKETMEKQGETPLRGQGVFVTGERKGERMPD
jgi:transposase